MYLGIKRQLFYQALLKYVLQLVTCIYLELVRPSKIQGL